MFVGHEKQTEIFRRAVKSGRLMHAYIFSGIKGIGKRLFAVNTAKALLCRRGAFFSPCGCPSCVQIDMGTHPDLHIYGEKETSRDGKVLNEDKIINIENVRKIVESAGMTPLEGQWKVYIIDGAHQLADTAQGGPAANALLKTLEEPGENTVFFLITDKYEAILPTIRSRAVNVKFSPLTIGQIRQALSGIVQEGSFIDRAALMSGGSVSRTLDILNEKFTDVTLYLKDGDFVKFAAAVQKFKTQEEISMAVSSVYPEALEAFKRTGRYSYCLLGYYLLDILRRFNYNANIDLIKADFSSKVIEVFSEAV